MKTFRFEKKDELDRNGAEEIPSSKEERIREERKNDDGASAKVDNVCNDSGKEKKVCYIYVSKYVSSVCQRSLVQVSYNSISL